jgi:hypothetical protein
MSNDLLIYGEIFAHLLLLYIRNPFHIYDFATAPLGISLYMKKSLFTFLSVYLIEGLTRQPARTIFALHFSDFTISVRETNERIGLQQGVTRRCRLSLLTNSAVVYESNCGGMGGSGVSANEYSCAHHVTWSPNKLWRY